MFLLYTNNVGRKPSPSFCLHLQHRQKKMMGWKGVGGGGGALRWVGGYVWVR